VDGDTAQGATQDGLDGLMKSHINKNKDVLLKGVKSRGAYLQYIDERIAAAKYDGGLSSETYRVLVDARKAFTTEFYA
jgi:hypothetical protein